MNRKSSIYFMLLLAVFFSVFSFKSKVYAKETAVSSQVNSGTTYVKAVKEEAAKVEKAVSESSAAKAQEASKAAAADLSQQEKAGGDKTGSGDNVKVDQAPAAEEDTQEKPATETETPVNASKAGDQTATARDEAKDPSSEDGKVQGEKAKALTQPADPADAELRTSEDKTAGEEANATEDKAADEEDATATEDPAGQGTPPAEEPNALPAEPGTSSPDLYLDGQKGDDNNDGSSKDKALKTFEKAKEKAKGNKDIKNIYITGTTSVEGEVSLKDTNAKLVRDENFNDYLLTVESGKEASLSDIVIDGNSENNKNIEKSLINVKSGATLNIKEGAVLKNNKIKAIKNTATRGGGIYAYKATINMSGGSVEGNQATYGGGIHLNKSTMNFTGGAVQNNRSDRVDDTGVTPTQYYSAGGGIIVSNGSTLNISGDAQVRNNFAAEVGGGISVGSNVPEPTNTLNMNGGIVDGNTAGSSGGGIFIQAQYFSGGPGVVRINRGQITNNHMDGTGKTNKAFGGGGIYVNGAPDQYGTNGELYLKNVLITNNTSNWHGAGIAGCPISKTTIYVNDGAALYGNHAGKPGNDLYLESSYAYGIHSGKAVYELAKRMLGGAYYNWTTPDGKPLSDEELQGVLKAWSELALSTNPENTELAKAVAQVIISGNTSVTRGGGIGSNGTIVIGTEDGSTEIPVEKKWEDKDNASNKRPGSIKVELVAKYDGQDYVVETREITADEDWKTVFKDLATKIGDAEIEYSVREVAVEGYESSVTGNAKDGFVITNSEKPETPKIDIKVEKKWDLQGNKKPPEKIEVELYRDGESTGKKLELNEENKWSGVFKDLEVKNEKDPAKEYKYTVKELGETGGILEIDGVKYEVSYEGNMKDGFVITNKEVPEEPPKTPPETPKEPPKEPPKTPPETPEEPPKTPPETPPEPPLTPPEKPLTPMEPPVTPPEKPLTPLTPQTPPVNPPKGPGYAPKTYDPGVGIYLALAGMSILGLGVLNRKKED